jgi:putative cell wall-binding protein
MLTLSMLAAVLAAPIPAQAQDAGPVVERASGPDRFATSAAISARTFPDPAQVDVVYLSTGFDFADALAAGASAARLGGPVLLVTRTAVTDPVVAELERLAPSRVVLVGGAGAIGAEVESQVRGLPGVTVERLGGANRFETAALLAAAAWPEGADAVFVATGGEFADALAGVPAAALRDAPLLLATGSSLPATTRDAITALAPDEVVVLGGRAAIGDDVVAEIRSLGPDVTRLAGRNRFETADVIARQSFLGAREVLVADGGGFADALAGGAAVAHDQGALLLATSRELVGGTPSVLADLNPRRVTVLGGTAALSDAVVEEIRQALAGTTALPPGALPDLLVSGAPTDGAPQALYAARVDGRHEALTSPPTRQADLSATWSPDGRRVAFLRITQAGFGSPEPVPHVMDFVQGPRSLRPLGASADCEGTSLAPTWRPGAGPDALLLACLQGRFEDPDGVDLRIAPLTGPAVDVVAAPGRTYTAARWAPDGRLSVLARTPGGSELRLLDEAAWTTGGDGELVTDQIVGDDFTWLDAQGGLAVLHRDADGDDQVLHGTIDGVTTELFRGPLDGASGPWRIADAHIDAGVILRSGEGRRTGPDVAAIVAHDGTVTPLWGPEDYTPSGADILAAPQFLPDGARVVLGEARYLGESGQGFIRISDGLVLVLDLATGDRHTLLEDWYFAIPDAVNPVGSGG